LEGNIYGNLNQNDFPIFLGYFHHPSRRR